MKKIILLIQSHEDAAALAGATKVLLSLRPEYVWILMSPMVVVGATEANRKLDEEMAALVRAEEQSVAVRDYTGAAKCKADREAKELDRQKAIADAWKSLSADDLKAKLMTILEPVRGPLTASGIKVRVNKSQDHHDTSDWIGMLNRILPAWQPEMSHGSYVIAWANDVASWTSAAPASVPTMGPAMAAFVAGPTRPAPTTRAAPAPKPAAKKQPTPEGPYTEEQLLALPFLNRMHVAKRLGVWEDGQKPPDTVRRILEAQSVAA